MYRSKLIIAMLITLFPSIGMAGVILDSTQFSEYSVSAADETPEDNQAPVVAEPNTFGLSTNPVSISHRADAVSSWPISLAATNPFVETTYGLTEWLFFPDSPVSKISKVPIV